MRGDETIMETDRGSPRELDSAGLGSKDEPIVIPLIDSKES